MQSKDQILDTIRRVKPELESQFHIKSIGLFGSALHGDLSTDSDIDLLVEFQKPIGLLKFMELEERLSEHLGRMADLVSRKALKPWIGRVILAEVVMA